MAQQKYEIELRKFNREEYVKELHLDLVTNPQTKAFLQKSDLALWSTRNRITDNIQRLKYIFTGVFDKNYFTFGSIKSKHKKNNNANNTEILIASGKFNELCFDFHSIDTDYVVKRLEQGKYYNYHHRSFKHWNNCQKVYFEGTFSNGRPVEGELYKYINENEQELLFKGKFETTTNNSTAIGVFSKFKQGQLYINNKLHYDGNFSGGYICGKGTTFYENGSIEFIGTFNSNEERHGQGMLFDDVGNLIAQGQFVNGSAPSSS
jgi:hypothetical protein